MGRCGSTKLGEITTDTLITLGTVMLTIKGTPYKFHMVANTFPIFEDGLISRNLLRDQEAVVSYYTNALVINRRNSKACFNTLQPK